MRNKWVNIAMIALILIAPLSAQSRHQYYYDDDYDDNDDDGGYSYSQKSAPRLDAPGEKVIIVDPRSHRFAAYEADGTLVRSGTATAGSNYCRDLHRPCHTRTGTFRIFSLGDRSCKSHKFPLRTHGGAPMPYCMYFSHGQALHGSPEGEVVNGNISHGCVRLHVWDAEWLRFNFVEGPGPENNYRGTKVIIKPY